VLWPGEVRDGSRARGGCGDHPGHLQVFVTGRGRSRPALTADRHSGYDAPVAFRVRDLILTLLPEPRGRGPRPHRPCDPAKVCTVCTEETQGCEGFLSDPQCEDKTCGISCTQKTCKCGSECSCNSGKSSGSEAGALGSRHLPYLRRRLRAAVTRWRHRHPRQPAGPRVRRAATHPTPGRRG
jgi:hypothetical protein